MAKERVYTNFNVDSLLFNKKRRRNSDPDLTLPLSQPKRVMLEIDSGYVSFNESVVQDEKKENPKVFTLFDPTNPIEVDKDSRERNNDFAKMIAELIKYE